MSEPSTSEGRQAHKELHALLECVAVQQAESSVSWRRGPELDQPTPLVPRKKEASVHLEQQKVGDKPPSVHARVVQNYNVRDVLNVCKRHKEDGASRDYHPRWGVATTTGRTGAHLLNPWDLRSSVRTFATCRSLRS
jgi:hypothetical protein